MYVKTIGDFKKLLAKNRIRHIYIDLDNSLLNTYLYYKTHLDMFPNLEFEPVFDTSKLSDIQKRELVTLWKNSNYFVNLRLCTLVNATSISFTILVDRDSDLAKDIFTEEQINLLFNRGAKEIVYLSGNSKESYLEKLPYEVVLFDDLNYTKFPKVHQIFVLNTWNRKHVNKDKQDFIFAY